MTVRPVPYLDLAAQYRTIRDDVDAAVSRVLESGNYVLGPEVGAFEDEFARYCGVEHAAGTSSGTSALHLALLTAGVGPGDEVVTVAYTFVATIETIRYTGARPVLVDVDPVSWTMDPRGLERALSPRTKAVVPVHLFGHPAEMEPIRDRVRERGATVIEDAAQAHGARYRDRPVGSLGDMACFSFYPTKNLGAYGEAGIVVTDDPGRAERVRGLRSWGGLRGDRGGRTNGGVLGGPSEGRGGEGRKGGRLRGFNYRLDEIQAAVLRAKLPHLDRWNGARRAVAARYDRELAGTGVRLPFERPWARHARHVYGIRVPDRDGVRARLAKRGIETGVHYPAPVHLDPSQTDLGHGPGDFPVAEALAREELSLPIYPELPVASQEAVCAALRETVDAAPGAFEPGSGSVGPGSA